MTGVQRPAADVPQPEPKGFLDRMPDAAAADAGRTAAREEPRPMGPQPGRSGTSRSRGIGTENAAPDSGGRATAGESVVPAVRPGNSVSEGLTAAGQNEEEFTAGDDDMDYDEDMDANADKATSEADRGSWVTSLWPTALAVLNPVSTTRCLHYCSTSWAAWAAATDASRAQPRGVWLQRCTRRRGSPSSSARAGCGMSCLAAHWT